MNTCAGDVQVFNCFQGSQFACKKVWKQMKQSFSSSPFHAIPIADEEKFKRPKFLVERRHICADPNTAYCGNVS